MTRQGFEPGISRRQVKVITARNVLPVKWSVWPCPLTLLTLCFKFQPVPRTEGFLICLFRKCIHDLRSTESGINGKKAYEGIICKATLNHVDTGQRSGGQKDALDPPCFILFANFTLCRCCKCLAKLAHKCSGGGGSSWEMPACVVRLCNLSTKISNF